nr:integrase, catalytic region, zinc finger, CCHC-type, peptidase aspartic, catalytic [Tanacetum cinerariifolium]
MSSITAQQAKLDLELVPKEKRLEIEKCNGRLIPIKIQREPTFQVVFDALALTPCYSAFLITTDVPEGQDFDALPTDEEIMSFLKDLGYTKDINSLNDVVVEHMHQPWRTFAALINKSLSGKTTGLEKLRLSRAQILWGDLRLSLQKYAELSAPEIIQADFDMKATNIILQGLHVDIYSLVNHHRVAKNLWERVQLLMQGTSLTKQEKECKMYDAFDKLTRIKEESLHMYYLRFTQLINDMNIYKMNMEQFHVNTKFLNSLSPEWSFAVPVFFPGDDPIACLNKAMAFLTAAASS